MEIQNNSSQEFEKKSRFNLGIQAFSEILELFRKVRIIGHKARKRYRNKDIISYLGIIETIYIPLIPVLLPKDKTFIENEIKSLKKSINMFNRTVNGDLVTIVEKLTELEKRLYVSIQNINMYIQLKSDYLRTSKRKEFMEHLEGSEIPELEDDDEFD